MPDVRLHGYFRSSAAYRVRIALNLKRVAHDDVFWHLRKAEQRSPDYVAINPQGLLPALETHGAILTQSLAICEYLEEAYPEPALLPRDPMARAKVRAFALAIACEIHPLQNLGVLDRLRACGLRDEQVADWARRTIDTGLSACEALIAREAGPYCFGDDVTLADVCLVPQLANARRFGVELRWPRLAACERACLALAAFRDAAPENQPDAD